MFTKDEWICLSTIYLLLVDEHLDQYHSALVSDSMAGSGKSYHCHWKQWWKRSSNTCCSKKILLLLVWYVLFTFSSNLLTIVLFRNVSTTAFYTSSLLSYCLAPLIGWFADIKFGRYEIIKFGSAASFFAGILYYFAMISVKSNFTLTKVLSSLAIAIINFAIVCYAAAMIPFVTDQIIGATSDELSAVVRWYVWVETVGIALSRIFAFCAPWDIITSVLIFAVPLAVIIISDCLCQQWLDRTHKVTNPIKLIIQVLNYTRKHRYPERRSAFTYIDEEQPTRMDYGKEKFGGPFTEEEVEDVKTVLRLIPLVICFTLSVTTLYLSTKSYVFYNDPKISVLNEALFSWLFPVLLIPLYQLLLYRFFHSCNLSMLRCIGAGLFVCSLGFILLSIIGVYGIIVTGDVQRYLSCTGLSPNSTDPGNHVEWYWKLDPCIMYNIGGTVINVLLYEFIIAQSPDKMKGFVLGISLAFRGVIFSFVIGTKFIFFTICNDLIISLFLVLLFVVFLVLSKCYTLRERNREINIQAIVEEHFERYLNQEEEYMRENPQYFESLESDSDVDSDSD